MGTLNNEKMGSTSSTKGGLVSLHEKPVFDQEKKRKQLTAVI